MRIKKEDKKPKKVFLDTKAKRITAISGAIIILLVIAVFMYIDSSKKCQLIVNNETDLNLEYVKAKYITTDYDLTNEVTMEKLSANKKNAIDAIPFEYLGYDAVYEITFKFENKAELFVDAGSFSNNFDGPIKVDFKKTDNPDILNMTIKANGGLLMRKTVYCNDNFTVDLKESETYQAQ